MPPIVPGSQEESLIKGLEGMNISRITDHVELLDWWTQIENQMCENVADEKSRRMIQSLSTEKEYAVAILSSVDSALIALNKGKITLPKF